MGVPKLIAMIGVCTAASGLAHASKTTADYLEPPILVDVSEDPELLAAQKRARATVRQFVARLQDRSSADVEFAVQMVVRDGDLEEYVWLTDVRFARGQLSGRVDTSPRLVRNVEMDARLRVAPGEITDWMIIERTLTGERLVGGYTVRVLQARERRGLVPDYLAYEAGLL